MKKKTTFYLTFNLASEILEILNGKLQFLCSENALLNLCQNTQKLVENQSASKTYQRKMQSR